MAHGAASQLVDDALQSSEEAKSQVQDLPADELQKCVPSTGWHDIGDVVRHDMWCGNS